jgi:hypothetical protein
MQHDRPPSLMSPVASVEAACAGCFLLEQTGGRCPMAQDASDLDRAEARRRAELLRVAVLAGVPDAPALIELVRREAQQGGQAVAQRALPPAPTQSIPDDSRKEAIHVPASRPVR